MKRIIIVAGIAGTMLFSACKKDDSMSVQPSYTSTQNNTPKTILAANTNTNTSNVANPNATLVNYNITITPPITTDVLQWNSGYLMAGNIFFDGNMYVGNCMTKKHYSVPTQTKVTLLPVSASANKSVLGSLSMLYGMYYAPQFGIVLAGVYPPDPTQNSTPALSLTGNYMKDGNNVLVQVIINQPTVLTANGENPTNMPMGQPNFAASLVFNLRQLTAGINANTLGNAIITNNTIIISENSNQNLYQLILNNLQSSLQVQFTPNIQNPVNQSIIAASGT